MVLHLPDPARVALAVDALCVGASHPVLVHTEVDVVSDREAPPPFALCCTPLTELSGLADTVAVLSAVAVPEGWWLAGLCAPTSIDRRGAGEPRTGRHAAWMIHVVDRSGAAATRLCVPDALELSGAADPVDPDHPLHRCLRRLTGPVGPPA